LFYFSDENQHGGSALAKIGRMIAPKPRSAHQRFLLSPVKSECCCTQFYQF